MKYPGLFSRWFKFDKRWLHDLPDEEKKAFAKLGYTELALQEVNLHSLGGQARAKNGKRDKRGRFISNSAIDNQFR